VGSATLEHRVKAMLKEDNKENEDKVTPELAKIVIPRVLKVLTRPQFEKFFSSEENIQKMKDKTYSLAELGEQYKELKISYHTMVATSEMFFNQSERSEDVNLAWLLLDSLFDIPLTNRILVVQNLILSGGLFLIPGFKKRLVQEIHNAIDNVPKYEELKALKEYIKIHK
jgi:actin-related protein